MKKNRLIILLFPMLILVGLGIFAYRYVVHRTDWAMSVYNRSIYKDGELNIGNLYDRNGILLSGVTDGVRTFSDDEETRRATVHATGDIEGYIGTGAIEKFTKQLTGYNLLTGTKNSGSLYLTIDSEINKVAYEALAGKNGTVAVCNYKTGEILCMVSSPGCDPSDPESANGDGAYMNRFISASFTPGSVYKIVTLIAALEEIPDIMERQFECDGSLDVDGEPVNCHSSHGVMGIEDAFAQSCNCAFAEIALELGGEKIAEYANKLGVTSGFDIDGIETSAGSFKIADKKIDTAWSGIGQYKDLVNPAAMLRIVSAIANGGNAVSMKLIAESDSGLIEKLNEITEKRDSSTALISAELAEKMSSMMNYNVYLNYGTDNFPGLELQAKSGTAEVGESVSPHSWFTGFIKNDGYPLAFVVIVENGGSGASTAGRIANTVLQSMISR